MLFISFSSCFLLLLSSAIISSNGLDPGQIKPCFERYVGYKLADAQPFHSEWRITSEEFCLEFCARSSSRCLSIVFDKANHVCHYFSMNGVKSDGVVKQRNFVYLQTTSNECLEKLLSIERPTSNEPINGVKSAEYLDQSNQQLILEGDAIPVFGHKQQQNQSMSDILERIDGELQMQLQQLQKKKAAQLFGAFRATKKQTNMDMADEQREIRRHPRINANQHEATGTGKEEQGEVRMDFGPSFLKEAAVPKRMTSSDNEEEEKANCEPGANVIWLTVENARFNGSTLKLGAVASPAECIKRVADMTAEGHHNFNAFSYLDVEKTCEFVHSGDEFPAFIGDGSLLPSPSADFSRRAFRRFCYPENLSPFNRCSDFLAFTDYEMKTEPREVFDGLPLGAEGTSACIELCVLSSEFQCLSGHFAATKGVCHLFDAHSLSNPGAFQSHREPDQLYFENGCIFIDGQNSEAKYPTLAQRTEKNVN